MTAPAGRLLRVDNLRVSFPTPSGLVAAVDGVTFGVGREKLGIVGESGSGKTMTGRAILKLLPPQARMTAARLSFEDLDLLAASEAEMLRVRGRRIAMILQDPKYSLNPVVPIGEQIAEGCRLHHRVGRREAADRALEMLHAVQIREPRRVFALFPHEVSGGMGQRIMIAMMLIPEPALLIADEPTSALDVTVWGEILHLLDRLIERRGLSVVFISHDLDLVRRFCDRVLIMYAGRIVEALPAHRLGEAQHAYTRGLLAALPRIGAPRRRLDVLARDPRWARAPGVAAP